MRGLRSTVHATASMTGGNTFGTIAVSSNNLRKGALVRIEIHASVAANRVARIAEPEAKTKELKNSS